ncbi:hypothetical protein [Sinorhizobium meliloti]|uniref:hypothetical protein n=1 Tax=Rhizobium meliloti TaxID=382 RepID=UPI0004895529|nr:hypothetical protein [Sinorhizobium meliloti]MDE4620641.1 hypothetical protein [Sinorhizobium meliloti]
MTNTRDAALKAWGSVDWIRDEGGRMVIGPDPRQIQDAFQKHGLDAFELGVIGLGADGNAFLVHSAAAALEAEMVRCLLNSILDTLGYEEVAP